LYLIDEELRKNEKARRREGELAWVRRVKREWKLGEKEKKGVQSSGR
jgi:hypothetical protein